MTVRRPKEFPAFYKCTWHHNDVLVREVFVKVKKVGKEYQVDFLDISEDNMEHERSIRFSWAELKDEYIGNEYLKVTESKFQEFLNKYKEKMSL